MDIISVAILTLGVNTWGAAFFDLNTLPPEFIEATALSVSGSNLTTPIVL